MQSLEEATKVYTDEGLHLEFGGETGTRISGDVGIIVHKKTEYFGSNVHYNGWTEWAQEAEDHLLMCRQ